MESPERVIRLNVRVWGEGTPLLMIHGLSDDGSFWQPMLPWLSPPFRVLAPDLRGHGGSDKPTTPSSIPLMAEDVLAVMAERDVSAAHFVGFSLGGAVAQQIALTHPQQVLSLTLMSSFSRCRPPLKDALEELAGILRREGMAGFFEAILPRVAPAAFIAANREALDLFRQEKVRTEKVPALLAALEACLAWDGHGKLNTVHCPCLILAGEDDPLTPPAQAEEIQQLIPGARFERVRGVSHNLLLPETVEAVARRVREFLDNLPGSARPKRATNPAEGGER